MTVREGKALNVRLFQSYSSTVETDNSLNCPIGALRHGKVTGNCDYKNVDCCFVSTVCSGPAMHRVQLCITKMYLTGQVNRHMGSFSILAFSPPSPKTNVNMKCSDLIFYFYRKWCDLVFYYASYWKLIKIWKVQDSFFFVFPATVTLMKCSNLILWEINICVYTELFNQLYSTQNTQGCDQRQGYFCPVQQNLISALWQFKRVPRPKHRINLRHHCYKKESSPLSCAYIASP